MEYDFIKAMKEYNKNLEEEVKKMFKAKYRKTE